MYLKGMLKNTLKISPLKGIIETFLKNILKNILKKHF